MSYPFELNDGGRSTSKRPKQKNDCTVRALALARILSYNEAYDILAEAGRVCSAKFMFNEWINQQPFAKKLSFPAVKGQNRMNPVKFCEQFPAGRYICKTAKHVFAVIDGVVYDDHRTYDERCIYTAWEITCSSAK